MVHIPIPLKSNGIYSFIPSSKNESIPGIVPKQHCSDVIQVYYLKNVNLYDKPV